jgi:hypothetical protein
MAGMNNYRVNEREESFIGPIISRSTLWARFNSEKVHKQYLKKKGTLKGKLTNLVTQSKYRASKSGWEHWVDVEFLAGLFERQLGKCALSGIQMEIVGKRGSDEYWKSISIDRIDSSKGYTEDNVQLVCTGVNYMKKDMSDEMFIHFCKTVMENQDG